MGERLKRWRAFFQSWAHLLLPAIFLASATLLKVMEYGAVEQLQNWVFDNYQRLHPRDYEDAPVRIIDIDDESLAKLGQWPWPRTLVADLVRRLRDQGASAIAFDIVFAERDRTSPSQIIPLWSKGSGWAELKEKSKRLPDHDQLLARIIAESNVVIGTPLLQVKNGAAPEVKASFAFNEDPVPYLIGFEGAVVNLPEYEKAAAGNGSFNPSPDLDGINRRVPLLFSVNERIVPSLAVEALRVAQGASNVSIKTAGASGETAYGGSRTGLVKVKVGSYVAPTDSRGRLWLHYTLPEVYAKRAIPAWRIFEKDFDPASIEGCIAFIGTSAAGLKDQRATPLDPVSPGVEVHAQVAEQFLLQKFLVRPDWALGAELIYLIVFGALLIFLLQRWGAAWGAVISIGATLASLYLSWIAYRRWNFLFDPVFPGVVVLLVYMSSSVMSYLRSEKERRQVRTAFSHYMAPALVAELAKNPDKLKLGGEEKILSVHFCDIEGFTTISESYDPHGLTTFLNQFLTPMTDIILKRRGTIDKYIGDCIMAFWNAPIDDPEHAKNACLATIEMHEALYGLNEARRVEAEAKGAKFMPIRLRTGLNTGNCIVGNMGSQQRFGYSVLGDDVNLASRLEGANKFFGTYRMASEATVSGARGAVEYRELGRLRVLGKTVPIKVYELLAKKGELSEDWKKALPIYMKAIADYYAREFAAALAGFQEILKIFPKDGPSSLYVNVATDFSALPPPDDWDGVFNLKEK